MRNAIIFIVVMVLAAFAVTYCEVSIYPAEDIFPTENYVKLAVRNETPLRVTVSFTLSSKFDSCIGPEVDIGLRLEPGQVKYVTFPVFMIGEKFNVYIHSKDNVRPTVGCEIDIVRGDGDWMKLTWKEGDEYIIPILNPDFVVPNA